MTFVIYLRLVCDNIRFYVSLASILARPKSFPKTQKLLSIRQKLDEKFRYGQDLLKNVRNTFESNLSAKILFDSKALFDLRHGFGFPGYLEFI